MLLSSLSKSCLSQRNCKFLQKFIPITQQLGLTRHEHKMPKHLENMLEEKEKPNFAHMVQYYYHAAACLMEPNLVKELEKKYPRADNKWRQGRVAAILKFIGAVSCCIEVTFPLYKTDGTYELITGYRAHHCRHRLPELMLYMEEKKTIKGFPNATEKEGGLLGEKCDILMPCATQMVLTKENAEKVQAKILLEGANGPVTPAADQILRKKNVLMIPDMYCNAGGVTVSYFEFLKNLNHVSYGKMTAKRESSVIREMLESISQSLKQTIEPTKKLEILRDCNSEAAIVDSGLQTVMEAAGQGIKETCNEYSLCNDLRTAANIFSINKIFSGLESSGISQ
uniref:Glutamate/phenylalanine/leucine/valine/L-tryptophan dehydrogenase C-terminal domain-containing protein n=1 Tax=Glossina palpalis gambiensis TaxID=67801 RepID=A0A1B0AVA1_9MUSC